MKDTKSGKREAIKPDIIEDSLTHLELQRKRSLKETIEALKAFREGNTLQGLSVREIIETGRR